MSLTKKLEAARLSFEKKAPAEVKEIMHRQTDDLRNSAQIDRILKEGDQAPDFELPDSQGRPVALADLRAKGPTILTFFRGTW